MICTCRFVLLKSIISRCSFISSGGPTKKSFNRMCNVISTYRKNTLKPKDLADKNKTDHGAFHKQLQMTAKNILEVEPWNTETNYFCCHFSNMVGSSFLQQSCDILGKHSLFLGKSQVRRSIPLQYFSVKYEAIASEHVALFSINLINNT